MRINFLSLCAISYQTFVILSLQFDFQCAALHAHKRRIVVARQVSRQQLTVESMFALFPIFRHFDQNHFLPFNNVPYLMCWTTNKAVVLAEGVARQRAHIVDERVARQKVAAVALDALVAPKLLVRHNALASILGGIA